MVWLGLFWFALSFNWGALLIVVVPAEVIRFAPEGQKGLYLGMLSAGGAFMAMVVSPIAGAVSDRSTLRLGRRRPFVLLGVLLGCLGLLGMRSAPVFGWFVSAFVLVQLGLNVAGGSFNGLIPDKVPAGQRGTASGVMGFMMMAGTIGGALVSGFLVGKGATGTVYLIIVGVVLACTWFMASNVGEEPLRLAPPFALASFVRSFWIDPRRYPDFGWMFVTRGLVMMGFYTMFTFLLFFIQETLHLTSAQAAEDTGRLSAVVIAAAACVALIAGRFSDRVGRKAIVSIAGMFLALTSVGLLFQPPFSELLGIGILFGIGYGAFTSVDWALAIDVLPPRNSPAQDLGIWAIANTLPQVLAPAIAGPIVDSLNGQTPGAYMGFRVIFSMAIVYVILGSVFVWKIKGAR